MKSDFIMALTQLASERNLPREIVLSAIEAALASAYRRDSIAAGQDISVSLDPNTGDVDVHVVKTVVEEVTEPLQEISLADAKKTKPDAEIGSIIAFERLPHSAGRIAAQTAKQVVIQRLREAERELVFREFADKEGEVFTVTVQRIEPRQIIVELGRAEAILPLSEQATYERYRVGQKIKVLLKSIRESNKGPEIIVSRSDQLLLKRLFEMEVPEIFNGSVEIIAVAREAGFRSKVAVFAKQDGVDAVGSCVGMRGIRIQNIVNELHGEKIDVVQWSKDPATFIAKALSPATVLRVDLDPESGTAVAVVAERQLSLAIGKEGQNARLSAKLTGMRVDIKSDVELRPAEAAVAGETAATDLGEPSTIPVERLGLSTRTLNLLRGAGILRAGQILEMGKAQLLQINHFGLKSFREVEEQLIEINLPFPPTIEQAAGEPEAPAEETIEITAEPVTPVDGAKAAEEELVEAPVTEQTEEAPTAEVQTAESAEKEEPQEEKAAGLETAATVEIPEEMLIPEVAPEETPVPVGEGLTSIKDLPEEVWSLPAGRGQEQGLIRFAEDIEELQRGPGGAARRGRRGGGARRGARASRGRKARAGRR